MLHPTSGEIQLAACCLLLLLGTTACRPDPHAGSDEQAIYLADYESPFEKWGVMDTTGTMVIPPRFDDLGVFSDGLAAANQQGLWGYIDRQGETVIPFQYRAAWQFQEGWGRVSGFEGGDAFINRHGKVLSDPEWDADDGFREGRARVRTGDAVGFIDTSGAVIIPTVYAQARPFQNGLSIVTLDGKLGVINRDGQSIIPARFETLSRIPDANYFLATTGSSLVVLTLTGEEWYRQDEVPAPRAARAEGHWMAIPTESDPRHFQWLLLDSTKLLPAVRFRDPIPLGNNRWSVRTNEGLALLWPPDQVIHPGPFTQLNRFANGYGVYGTEDGWGYLDSTGAERTGAVFGLAWDYREGFARAAFQEGIAFINRHQRLAFYPPPGAVELRDFQEGLAPVQLTR